MVTFHAVHVVGSDMQCARWMHVLCRSRDDTFPIIVPVALRTFCAQTWTTTWGKASEPEGSTPDYLTRSLVRNKKKKNCQGKKRLFVSFCGFWMVSDCFTISFRWILSTESVSCMYSAYFIQYNRDQSAFCVWFC